MLFLDRCYNNMKINNYPLCKDYENKINKCIKNEL